MKINGRLFLSLAGAASLSLPACMEREEDGPTAATAANRETPAVVGASDDAIGPMSAAKAPGSIVAEAAADAKAAADEEAALEAGATGVATTAALEAVVRETSPAPSQAAERVAATIDPPAAFAMCTTCHSTRAGEAHRIGPNLFGVVGSNAGGQPGYTYSDAMKSSSLTWTPAKLQEYILSPQAVVPGTKMMVSGPSDERTRRKMVDYLASLK